MFGEHLRRIRLACGRTQAQVAACLNISAQSISKWEKNLALPTVDVLPKLANYFGCSVNAFFSEYELEIFECLSKSAPTKDDIIRLLSSLLPQESTGNENCDCEAVEATIPAESLFTPAVYKIVSSEESITCGLLQGRLKVGYAIAARIIEALENIGIVTFNERAVTYDVRKDKISLLVPYIN